MCHEEFLNIDHTFFLTNGPFLFLCYTSNRESLIHLGLSEERFQKHKKKVPRRLLHQGLYLLCTVCNYTVVYRIQLCGRALI